MVSKTPEYILFVNNLNENDEDAIEKVLDGLYKIIDDTKTKYDDVIVIKKYNVVRVFKNVIGTLKNDVQIKIRSRILIPENDIKDIENSIHKLQETLNVIENRYININNIIYEYLIRTPIYLYRGSFKELRNIYKDLILYTVFYIDVYAYKDQLDDLEYKIEELEKGINELKIKYIQEGGRVEAKYKSTGEHTHILYNNRKLKRCIYENIKGRGEYCKINNKYILLSKLKKYKLI
jgi:hypothetical protein